MERDIGILEFELSRFEGVLYDDVIESLCFSHPQGDKVQTSGISDKTGKQPSFTARLKKGWMMTGLTI